jgi:ABC-2 type transport system permease protein
MNKALAVAKWEYIEKIKSKAFLISLVLMPVIMIGFGVVPTIFAARPDSESKIVGVVDASGEFAEPLAKLLEQRYILPGGKPNYILRPLLQGNTGDIITVKNYADSLVSKGEIEGYLVLLPRSFEDSEIEYRTRNVGNIKLSERLISALRDVIAERKLRLRGIDPSIVNELTKRVDVKTIKLSATGKEEESGFGEVFFTAYIFMMMMFFLVMTSGQLLVRSMLEEKSNRVIEVLMSSSSSNDLMAGKIIGLSGLGLTQLAFWGLIGFAISLKFGVVPVSLESFSILIVYFILGYLLYAGIFVAAGAPVSTEQEAQQITSYLTMVLVVPIALALPVLENPNSLMVKILSFIPLLTPTMMAIRIPVQMPSTGEIVATMSLLGVSAMVMMWAAGKIFRTTILMYGKRPGLAELWRIVRSA